MVNVTERIRQVQQPRGGFLNPRTMEIRELGGAALDHTVESVHTSVVGSAVELLTRIATGTPVKEALSWEGIVATRAGTQAYSEARQLIDEMDYTVALYAEEDGDELLSDDLLVAACRLVSLLSAAHGHWQYDPRTPTADVDELTIEHIRTMVTRSVAFFRHYGPVLAHGLVVTGAAEGTVDWGEVDFLTADTLWDFKVIVKPPSSVHTLQLLMLWIMGTRQPRPEFKAVVHVGLFNPRQNVVYRISVDAIAPDTIAAIASEVLGYK